MSERLKMREAVLKFANPQKALLALIADKGLKLVGTH